MVVQGPSRSGLGGPTVELRVTSITLASARAVYGTTRSELSACDYRYDSETYNRENYTVYNTSARRRNILYDVGREQARRTAKDLRVLLV